MKINVNIVLLITAAVIVPLTLSNCVTAIGPDTPDTPGKAKNLLELEKSSNELSNSIQRLSDIH